MRGAPPWRGDASGTARTRVQLPDRHLDTFISVLVATQQFVLVGRIASARLAAQAPWLAQAFAVLSVITFDVRALAGAKPGLNVRVSRVPPSCRCNSRPSSAGRGR